MTGWKCPNCGRCYSPWVSECKYCNTKVENTTFVTTTLTLSELTKQPKSSNSSSEKKKEKK